MRILFVTSTLRSGGAERVCAVIASRFSADHDVSLVKFDKDEPFYELASGVKLINLGVGADELGLVGNLKKRVSKVLALRALIREGKFDAVISFLDAVNTLVLFSSAGLKTPIIISEHTNYLAPKRAIFKVLRRISYPFANALSVLSDEDLGYYSKFCKNVMKIYNPLFEEIRSESFAKENLVIFVGRLNKIKNCEMFVRVAANLKQSGYKFVVAGDGGERLNLENLAKSLGADVEFLGNVSDIAQLYKRAKVLLSCSNFEGLGNTLIEAINYDCVRVATKTSGAKELIKDGFDGLLCEINDADQMSEKLANLIQDEAKMGEFVKNARARLDEFSVEQIYKKWLELLRLGGVK